MAKIDGATQIEPLSITNAEIATGAAIAYSKLALTGSIVNADIVSLAWSKLTGTPMTLAGYGIADPIVLTSGSYANPGWITSLAASKLTGTLGADHGGTGLASYAVGDLPYASATTTLSKLAAVAVGSVLVSGGVTTAPAWSATPSLTSVLFNQSAAYPVIVDPAAIDAAAPTFRLGVATFAGVNLPDTRANTVMTLGWNMQAGGGRFNTAEVAQGLSFESYFVSGGVAASEFHITTTDLSGVEHRPFTAFLPRSGTGGRVAVNGDVIALGDYAGTTKIQVNLTGTPNISMTGSAHLIFDVNNVVVAKQHNAANAAFLNLPYFDADNRLHLSEAPVLIGAVPTGGTYPNIFAALQATSMPNNGTVLSATFPAVTGSVTAFSYAGSVTNNLTGLIYNQSNTANANPILELLTIGASGGDPQIRFNVNGVTTWYVGLDNSDSDKFKWAMNDILGAADRMVLTTAGDLSFVGSLTMADAKNIILTATTGTKIGTATTQKLGFFNATPVVQQTRGATLTNNVTAGGTTDTIADFTDLSVYATDAATIRNDIYQLARIVRQHDVALRALGLES